MTREIFFQSEPLSAKLQSIEFFSISGLPARLTAPGSPRMRERTSSHAPIERKQSALKILEHNLWVLATFALEKSL